MIGFIAPLFASVVAAIAGGLVAGYFVLPGVNVQFRRQSEAACRALFIEVVSNNQTLSGMTLRLAEQRAWEPAQPNPGWLSQAVWSTQLPLVVQLVDPRTAEALVKAYSFLAALPEMRQNNVATGVPYSWGIDQHASDECG